MAFTTRTNGPRLDGNKPTITLRNQTTESLSVSVSFYGESGPCVEYFIGQASGPLLGHEELIFTPVEPTAVELLNKIQSISEDVTETVHHRP